MAEGNLEPYRRGVPDSARCLAAAEQSAIAAFLATKAVRKCVPNDSGDDFNICAFLRRHGYTVQRNCAIGCRRAPFFINDKAYSRKSFLKFVNGVRARFDLQPLGALA